MKQAQLLALKFYPMKLVHCLGALPKPAGSLWLALQPRGGERGLRERNASKRWPRLVRGVAPSRGLRAPLPRAVGSWHTHGRGAPAGRCVECLARRRLRRRGRRLVGRRRHRCETRRLS